ncbi:MAG: hypothetical protein WA117_14850 [Verrucomicrobiia bacterium]
MKATVAKIVVRAIGTLIALLGMTLLGFGLLMLKHAPDGHTWIELALMLLILPFVVWFVYVGYLVWADFSPLVVRHVCGVFAYLCFSSILSRTVVGAHAGMHSPWILPAFVGLILVTWAVYRIVSKRLNRWLFPEFG